MNFSCFFVINLYPLIQVLFCWCSLRFHIPLNAAPVQQLLLMTHFFATLTTNYSLSMMSASSAVTVKLVEPIVTALLSHYIAKTTKPSLVTFISLGMVSTGAVQFIGNPLKSTSVSVGTLLMMISNSLYGLRNITKKHSLVQISLLAPCHYIYLLAGISGIILCSTFLININTLMLLLMITGASLSHMVYSYISMCIVLRYLGSAVSHATANICKRVLVVMVLMGLANEPLTTYKLAWLSLCSLGLLLFNRNLFIGISSGNQTDCSDRCI